MAKKMKGMTEEPTREQRLEMRRNSISGLWIPAGLFIGLGLGFLYGKVVAGALLGLGLGFVGMAISRIILGK
jgi:hypothetical protein